MQNPNPNPNPKPNQQSVLLDRRPRRKWDSNIEFVLTCIAATVGLGNFWRFPYVAYKHGGGTFVFVYAIVLFLVGQPLYYLDLALGQFSGKSTVGLYYKLAPAWLGVGICQCFCAMGVISYYAHILAMALFYLGSSFTTELPWTSCQKEWGSDCVSSKEAAVNNTGMSSAECYLHVVVLKAADSVDDGLGVPDWRMLLCLFVVWVIAFIYILVGVKSAGKLSYFVAVFPYVVLTVLLVRTLFSDGAVDGVLYFFNPEWKEFITPEIWLAAISQLFFSLGIGYGTNCMFASYNHFKTDIIVISYVVAFFDSFTSVLSGMTIFSALGSLAHRLDLDISQVIKGDGMSLGFVSYPDAISGFEQVPYLFSVIFFLMFLTLGLGSLSGFQQVVSSNMLDIFPRLKEWHASLITSSMGFITGIIFTTPGGQSIVKLVDLYGNVYVLMVNAICAVIAVLYVYGMQNWCWDLEFMHGKTASRMWRVNSSIITFGAMLFIYIYGCFENGWLTYNNKPVPAIMMISGYTLLALCSSPIPITFIYYWNHFHKDGRTCKEAGQRAFSSEHWMPNDEALAEEITEFRKTKLANYPLTNANSFKKFFSALVKDY